MEDDHPHPQPQPPPLVLTCWKCKGSGSKLVRTKCLRNSHQTAGPDDPAATPSAPPSPATTTPSSIPPPPTTPPNKKKQPRLTLVSCSLCGGTGTTKAAPLNDTTKPTPKRILRKGLVRPFNPPPGWTDSGPTPYMDIQMAASTFMSPDEGSEMITALCGRWSIFQLVQGHRYTTDDVCTAAVAMSLYSIPDNIRRRLSASFATVSTSSSLLPPPKRHLDIGCGLGSVLLFTAWKFHSSLEFSIGIEAQAKHVQLARKSILVNMGIQPSSSPSSSSISSSSTQTLTQTPKCKIIHGDLRNIGTPSFTLPESGSFDLITGTPPYFPSPNGVLPTVQGRGMCAFELRGGIETYCNAASHMLSNSPDARFVVAQTALEIVRSEKAIWSIGCMQILERWDIYGCEGKSGPLFVVFVCGWDWDGVACLRVPVTCQASSGYPVRPLYVRTREGGYTEEYRQVLMMVGKPPPKE